MGVVRSIHSSIRTSRMTPGQFAAKWSASTLKERSAAQEHFIDLCHVLNEPTPAEADPHGDHYCFERGARKTGGGDGWADVWRKDCFAWEYKGKHKDLEVAFAQLQRYSLALDNPPLLVVSDMDRIEVHTNFNNTVHRIHLVPIAELGSEQNLKVLKSVFSDPDQLKPGRTKTAITEEAAQRFASIAQVLRDRGGEPQRVAHFLNRVLFCLFAQDAKLLPNGVVRQLLETGVTRPDQTNQMLRYLFGTMRKGGVFGPHVIEWFNGGLFDSSDAVPLEAGEIKELLSIVDLDWSAIEPSVFGTLFERGLDPDKRAQIGAHYTDSKSIMRIVQPIVIDPLAVRWNEAKREIELTLAKAERANDRSAKTKSRKKAQQIFDGFLHHLAEFRVLDPACGSGNFLYLALQALKDLEHRATLEAELLGLQASFAGMHVGVQCVRGIELNAYAAELARVTVWIGEIQWMLRHGIPPSKNPILKPLETIECRDAVYEDGKEPLWPKADAIVGNPPFLGSFRMRGKLGDEYTEKLRKAYAGRVDGAADLVCYWFEKARNAASDNPKTKIGLVATNSIRQPTNRRVLERILENGVIRTAWADEPWTNDGAAVRVSIVCFDMQSDDRHATLNGINVAEIYADLSGPVGDGTGFDLTKARTLPTNLGWSYFGFALAGPFTVTYAQVKEWLKSPNAHGRPNSDVLRPLWNGADVTGRWNDRWVIDFAEMKEEQASYYEKPFEFVVAKVKPIREANRRPSRAKYWWRYGEARPGLRKILKGKSRSIATSEKSKHRFFVWLPTSVAPDNRLIVFPNEDDGMFGVLSSRIHVCWALAVGSTLEDRPAYATKNCFDKFPFPHGMTPNLSADHYSNGHAVEISELARKLDQLRGRWLNPPEWCVRTPAIFTGYPEIVVATTGHEQDLKRRTLTNLYNDRPTWLVKVHQELDAAVAAGYGWADYTPAMPDDEIVARLLKLNLARTLDLFSSPEKPIAVVRESTVQSEPNAQNWQRVPDKRPSPAALERRLAIVSTLVNRLSGDPHFGRTKMAKLFYLADVTQNLELQTTYYREAAGPLDIEAVYDEQVGFEALAVQNGYAEIENNGQRIRYRRGPNIERGMEQARSLLGTNRTNINRLIDTFRKLNTDRCEIVATLFACWNDLLIDGLDATDDAIVDQFLNAWNEKKRRFARPRLLKALTWMREKKLVPKGIGAHTKIPKKKSRKVGLATH